jgi:dTDP-4-amino-4,6-dideoxygalactose transaminase
MNAGLALRLDASGPIAIQRAAPQAFARSTWPRHEEDEIAAVVEVLRSGRVNALTHGDRCRAFEAAFAERCDMPHAIAMANGTVTLEVALKALGIGPGDEVVVTPRSFMASAGCVVAVGARPVFADVDPDSQLLTAAGIEAVLTPRTRAIVPVHLAGWPCDMPAIMALARAHGLVVIEDCAQAHGARLDGRPVGSFGDAASFSFCTDKIMSTGGEGGILLLRDPAVHARAWSLKDHGKRLAAPMQPGIAFRWLHDDFGSNHRLTEMQAAIGLVQLGKLDRWLEARRCNAAALFAALEGCAALRLPRPGPNIAHAWYKFGAFVRADRLRPGASRDSILLRAHAGGVPVFAGTCPEIYCEEAFRRNGMQPPAPLPVARALGTSSLMLQVDHSLDPADVAATGKRLAEIVEEATA